MLKVGFDPALHVSISVEAYATRENKRKDDLFEGGMDEVRKVANLLHPLYTSRYHCFTLRFPLLLTQMEQTIFDIVGQKMKLVHQKQVLPLSRAMIQAESPKHRILFLKVLQVCVCVCARTCVCVCMCLSLSVSVCMRVSLSLFLSLSLSCVGMHVCVSLIMPYLLCSIPYGGVTLFFNC